jgi:hypothetical protein
MEVFGMVLTAPAVLALTSLICSVVIWLISLRNL